jgi:hypothetical protein
VVIVLRNRWLVLLTGLFVGAVAGLAVYQGSRLSGQAVYVLAGATAGVVAAVIVTVYNRSVQLTDIKVTIPQLSELNFTVTRDSQQVAWKLFVESVTRISTQALPDHSGSLREAMTSLYGMFNITRETLKQAQPSRHAGDGPTVEHLAIALLNNELRPFLARWHPELGRWEKANPEGDERSWPLNPECRADLATTQQRLVHYVLAFGKLAGFDQPTAMAILQGQLADGFAASARIPASRTAR